ncbi:MAG: hypothetical protein JWM68_2408 [Verrucomicrobiales bacterium]|nr:hypothetical protein [Verrucomicrobiales bacterium]
MIKLPCALLFSALITLRMSGQVAQPEVKNITSVTNPTALAKASPAQIKAFFTSADYKKKHRSDAEFLNDLFRGILHREPDTDGFQNWIASLHRGAKDPKAREKAVDAFLKSPEFLSQQPGAKPVVVAKKKQGPRNPANVLFDQTGVFVSTATAFPADRYASLLKKARVAWVSLQIDNTGAIRDDNVASINAGWMKTWRDAGFKVGFWGCPRGMSQHNSNAAIAESTLQVQTDAVLGVKLTAQYHGDFYIADCEDGYQGYNPTDPTPMLNRVYVDAFQKAALAAGIEKLPRALSSMGRVALDMQPWIDAGWDTMPQAYWNSYAVYQPSKCVDFYVKEAGWPIERVHPTISTFTSEGEKRVVSLEEYGADLKTRETSGFSFYLPESYLLFNESLYEQLARMGAR